MLLTFSEAACKETGSHIAIIKNEDRSLEVVEYTAQNPDTLQHTDEQTVWHDAGRLVIETRPYTSGANDRKSGLPVCAGASMINPSRS